MYKIKKIYHFVINWCLGKKFKEQENFVLICNPKAGKKTLWFSNSIFGSKMFWYINLPKKAFCILISEPYFLFCSLF